MATEQQQQQYDDAMFDFSTGDYDSAIAKLKMLLQEDPAYFEAQLAVGMAFYRKADYATALAEGHKAEQMRPQDQLVHTNLSLFYMRSGNKEAAEPDLQMARPKQPMPQQFPDMPWKKKPKPIPESEPASPDAAGESKKAV